VPQASEIVFATKDKEPKKTILQVSNDSEHAKMLARENMKPVNEFDLHLFDISNTKIKHDETEHLPGGLVG